MALPSFQPKVRVPLQELIVAEERKSFSKFVPQISAVSLLETLLKHTSESLLTMKENKNEINTPLIHKNYDHKDLVYSESVISGNKVKLVAGKEHGSVLKKPIQKAMILAAQAKIDFVKPAKKIRQKSAEEEFSYKNQLNKVVSIFQNIEKTQETSQVQAQLENSTKYNISNFSQNTTNAKKPGNKNIVCINSISSTASNKFKLGGLNITINDEDEDKFSLPFSGKTIKAIV